MNSGLFFLKVSVHCSFCSFIYIMILLPLFKQNNLAMAMVMAMAIDTKKKKKKRERTSVES